jgi:hypothetical protein
MCVRTALGEFPCERFENMKPQLICPFPFYEDPVVVPPGKEFAATHFGLVDDGWGLGKPPGEQLVGVVTKLDDIDRHIFAEHHVAVVLVDKAGDAAVERGHRCAKARLGTMLVYVGPQRSSQLRTTLAAAKRE